MRRMEKLLGPGLSGVLLKRTTTARVDGLLEYIVPDWYQTNLHGYGSSRLGERVWVANRCQQMNAQQIASMPLEFTGPDGTEPLWVTNPDSNWYPNGVADAIFAIVSQMYGWGFAVLYVTSRYSTGYPRTWTVLDSCGVQITMEEGYRAYKYWDTPLDPDDVVQIDRNPGPGLHGTPALKAYASSALGLLAAQEQALAVNSGTYPSVYLQPKRPINEEQATKLQRSWMEKTMQRHGGPPVVPPDIDVNSLQIDPASLALLDAQEFGARSICTAYGVPSVFLNLSLQGGLTYQNPGALGEMWWRFELRNTSTRIENALSTQMLPRGQYITVDAGDTFAGIDTSDDPQAAEDAETGVTPQSDLVPSAPAATTGG